MKLRQQKRNIIGTANVSENKQQAKSMRSKSMSMPHSHDQSINPETFMESEVNRKMLQPLEKLVKPRPKREFSNDDHNLARLAVRKESPASDRCNLHKIAEIKRVLLKKYGQKLNYIETFKVWDEEGKGSVTAQNVRSILSNMNIQVSDKEAEILLASADLKGQRQLGASEFYNLVFDQSGSINRPGQLAKTTQAEEIIETIYKENKERLIKRQKDYLQTLLISQAPKLKRSFLMLDGQSQGTVNRDQLQKIFRNQLKIREDLIRDQDLDAIYAQNNHGGKQFYYQEFLKGLSTMASSVQNESSLPSIKQSDDIAFVQDCQRINVQALDRIKKRADNQIRHLKTTYKNEEELKEFILGELKLEKEQFDTQKIKQSDLANLLLKATGSTSQKQIEGILNLYVYNTDKETCLGDILKPIYNENPREMYQRLNIPRRGLPPFQTSIDDKAVIEEKHLVHAFEKLLSRIGGTNCTYRLFKDLDVDNDGFISRQDITKRLKSLNLEHAEELVKYLDSDNKGYLDFQEFSQKVNKQAAITRPQVEDHLTPSKLQTEALLEYIKTHKIKTQESAPQTRTQRAHSQFNGQFKVEGVPNTSMYMSEERRLHYDKSEVTNEERIFKQQRRNQRLLRIKESQDAYNNRVKEEDEKAIRKLQSSIEGKQRQRANFEERNQQQFQF